jgi:hypothetical protein
LEQSALRGIFGECVLDCSSRQDPFFWDPPIAP